MTSASDFLSTHHAVVTDTHVHALWLCCNFERHFLTTDESAYYFQHLGFPTAGLTVSGIPIHPSLSQTMDRAGPRLKHEIDPAIQVILLSVETFGMESSMEAVRALLPMW